MRNHWLSEIEVKNLVTVLNTFLKDMFRGTKSDLDSWGPAMMRVLWDYGSQKVTDRILSAYTIEAKYDEQGRVQSIKLMMLPWSI